MLDNIVTETCMAAMPIEILADAKVNNKSNKHIEDRLQIKAATIINQTTGAPVTKTNKTKTILNWLKNNTISNTTTIIHATTSNKTNKIVKSDNREISSCTHIQQIQQQKDVNSYINCTCPKAKQRNNTASRKDGTSPISQRIAKKSVAQRDNDDDTLRDFRGVQTLKHFWNKRITANRESTLRVKGSKHQFTKSVSCLVNAINNTTGEPPPSTSSLSPTSLSEKELLKTRKLRALSLHDCSRNSTNLDEILLSDIDIQKHLEKDNFYKYKTAEQASKLRELSEHSAYKKLSNSIILPVGHKYEAFDWLKRHDKFSRKKSLELILSPTHQIKRNSNHQLIAATCAANNNDITINEHKMYSPQLLEEAAFLPSSACQNILEIGKTNKSSQSSISAPVVPNNSQQHEVSCGTEAVRKESTKTLGSASSISRDSSSTSLTASANSLKSAVKRSSSTRKYSFKTHTRSYHAPRKMHTNKDSACGTAGIIVNSPNSIVAKLTHQFNEIMQNDKTLLEEIKRKNGVLMTHKGHVYKVVDTSSLNRNHSPTISRNTSRAQDANAHQIKARSASSTVQRNIKKFESESRGLKPKVPLKSLQVLRKSNDLVINKNITAARSNISNSRKKDTVIKSELKPQTALTPTLEIVQEEAKTPVENSDKKDIKEIINSKSEFASGTSADELFRQDDFMAILPRKIDSVIYKSIHRSKQKKTTVLQTENSTGIPKEIQSSLQELIHTTDRNNLSSQLKIRTENEEEPNAQEPQCVDNIRNKDYSSEDDSKKIQNLENELHNEKEAENMPNNDCTQQSKNTVIEPPFTTIAESEPDTTTIDNTGENSTTSPEPLEDEDKKKRKHKYAKIYEKLRFLTPFSHTNKKQKLTNATSPNRTDVPKSEESITPLLTVNIAIAKTVDEMPNTNSLLCDNSKLLKSGEYTPMISSSPKKEFDFIDDDYSIMCNPEAKLLNALEQVDKKLQNLSNGRNAILEVDEYGQPLKPNSSFLHQNKDLAPTQCSVIEAVNVTLVNSIEGEQMVMEQKEIQHEIVEEKEKRQEQNQIKNYIYPLQILTPKKTDEDEPLYEPICTDKPIEIKTEQLYRNSEFNNTKDCNNGQCEAVDEEDIYQTVEEAKNTSDQLNTIIKDPVVVKTCIHELDGYEPIENPDEAKPSASITDSCLKTPIHFDGYEEYTPAVEKAPLTTTNTGVRRVTDELPDLPKPKRVLPKSPIPCRPAPKPPIFRHQSTEEESLKSHGQDQHYYGGDENIYDTIKGSHCYESLQSVSSKLQNSATLLRFKHSDCLSLSSNCYETISQYKRPNTLSHHSAGSSNGSTLTISSENKTNSLYEDSLNSSLHYVSKRIYQMHAHTRTEINKISRNVNTITDYTVSPGCRTDTSDEWTDVSDNENDNAKTKPQFIIVRERSKAHKSPDWSKRVRDKRQRKSKSCIEDDDPDHFYEQLSPSALSKRHSLLEHTRANSLQRNENSVRVSKRGKQMSYSAHALGQHISDDSFDSDTDDYYESGHFKNAHNDSGVDIRNTKLPDPPSSSSSNQMYSFVKKFKNFIVNKKSPNTSKLGSSQHKIYDSSSQVYANGQYEEKSQPAPQQALETKELSTSEKNLILAQSTVSPQTPSNTSTTPRKLKSGKSLRSRLRKSLVGFDSKQLSIVTPTRSTFYIEDPVNDEHNRQLDSGFSEKNLSEEIPTTTSIPTEGSQKFSTFARKANKEAKLNNSQRRRTTIGIRPHEPPPPPPPDSSSKPRRQSNTSWYAECGVFKNGTTNLVHDESHILNTQNNNSAGSTWYEEAGLYQTSGMSVASSSGSSGVSTSNEAGPADEMTHSMFSNEPLYQIYSAAKLEAISRDMQDESSTDGYEEIGDRLKNETGAEETRKSSRPSALQLVEPKSGPERTLWSQIPEVINSYIIPTMTPRERALIEAKFEIITSEASYLKSLNLLRSHYMNHPVFRDQNVVSSRDRKSLFAHIVPVHECSEKLLTELESCWQDNIMLIGLSKRIYAVAEKHFNVYVGFCEHQGRMDRTLKHLRESKGLFAQNLELLESSAACCGLNLHSFLMLPMQRVTRLPLLIDAVFSKCHPNDDEYENWKMCLAIMNKIVTQCNEAANKSEQAFEIERISRQLEFNPSAIRPLAIAPAGVLAPGTKPRFLVKKGELTHLIWRGDDAKLTFGKKFSKTTIFAFLFSDLLVLTKRKAEEQFSVFDYCPRNMLTITSGDSLPQLPTKDLNSQTSKNLMLMTLLENHERKTVELLLSCPSVSEQERWLQAMRPPESETPGEKLYEQWDCPQVIAKHAYENNEPDTLNLDIGDVVNVTRKLPDGWYKGERIRDGAVGWFPGSYTEEVNSVHVRARNLKQRHRLLTFTATYLESQKRNK